MKKIYVCSKLRGNIKQNIEKAKEYCRFVISKGHIPYAPHIYFTQFLDDTKEVDRKTGMEEGIWWLTLCKEIWVFGKEISEGMQKEIDFAKKNSMVIKYVRDE